MNRSKENSSKERHKKGKKVGNGGAGNQSKRVGNQLLDSLILVFRPRLGTDDNTFFESLTEIERLIDS